MMLEPLDSRRTTAVVELEGMTSRCVGGWGRTEEAHWLRTHTGGRFSKMISKLKVLLQYV